jgi:MFS family permease
VGWVPEILRDRDFRRLYLARSISILGNRIAPIALAFAVLEIGDAGDLGFVIGAATVPSVLFILFGGVLADRLSPPRMMFIADVVDTVVQGITAALLITGNAELWHLAILQFMWGASSAFFNPASMGVVPLVAPPGRLQDANATLSFARQLSAIVGPALAGVLVASVGTGWAFAVDAASFGLSAFFLFPLLRLGERSLEIPDTIGELKAGWTEFVSRRWLWTLVMYFGFFHVVFIAPVSVLGPAVADASLGGAKAWAAIATAGGIGGIIGGLLGLRIRPERTAFVVAGMGFLLLPVLIALAIPAPVFVIAAGEFLAGGTFAYGGTLWDTTLQEHIPRNMLSRVSAYDWLGSTLLLPLGTIAAGVLGVSIGFGPTLIGGAILLVVSTAAVMLVKDVRELKRPTIPMKEEMA